MSSGSDVESGPVPIQSTSREADENQPLMDSNIVRVKVEIVANALALVTDEMFDFVANRSVKANLLVFLNHKKIHSRFHDVLCFRTRQHVLLDNTRTMAENGVQSGDTLWLCIVGRTGPFYRDPDFYGIFHCFLIALVFVVVVVICILWPYGFRVSTTQNLNYGVVIDAGSVHTTLSVYDWNPGKLNGTGIVKEKMSCELSKDVGISSFDVNPVGVRNYLINSKCFKDAVQSIPLELRSRSNVFLGATAGMRILNSTNSVTANMIMGNISDALNESELLHIRGNAKILSGSDEGVLGWITSNYLSNVLETEDGSNRTAPMGALDWGGASSQITFAVNDSMSNNTRKEVLYGENYNIFTKSNLCYGQSEAVRRYYVQLIYKSYKLNNNTFTAFKLNAPCQPRSNTNKYFPLKVKNLFFNPCTILKDKQFQEAAEKLPKEKEFHFHGTSQVQECLKEVQKTFNYSLCLETYQQPHCFNSDDIPAPDNRDIKYLAFSTYYYLNSFLDIKKNVVSEPEFHGVVKRLCNSDSVRAHELLGAEGPEVENNSCFKGLFMHQLLTKGYRLTRWETIQFVQKVANAEVGWTLGYMIQKTNYLPSIELIENGLPYLAIVVAVSTSLVLILLILYALRVFCQNKNRVARYDEAVHMFNKT